MKKILLVGEAPLAFHPSLRRPAAGLRTTQFVEALGENHQVFLFLFTEKENWPKHEIPSSEEKIIFIERHAPSWEKKLRHFLKKGGFDAVCAVNALSCERVAKLRPAIPFWADINGSPLAESESQAWRMNSNQMMPFFWSRERKILLHADVLSTCSNPQKFWTLGLLASLGRLHKNTMPYAMVHAIPNLISQQRPVLKSKMKKLKGEILPAEAFVVSMLGGGWNTWLDEDSLFSLLEKAMDKHAEVHFVASGSPFQGLSLKPFDEFYRKVQASIHKNRFHFFDLLAVEDLEAMYQEVDMCINMDRFCLDTLTGARNRISEWAYFGKAILSTLGSEISYELKEAKALYGIEIGDVEEGLKILESCLKKPLLCKEIGERAASFCQKKWADSSLMKSFQDWAQAPFYAPDSRSRLSFKESFWNTLIKPFFIYAKNAGFAHVLKRLKKRLF